MRIPLHVLDMQIHLIRFCGRTSCGVSAENERSIISLPSSPCATIVLVRYTFSILLSSAGFAAAQLSWAATKKVGRELGKFHVSVGT